MLTNTERQQIVEEVNAGTYGIDEALDDIAAAQKGEEVRKALYAEALVLNREGHAGSTDMIARQKIANLQTTVNGQISTFRTEVGEDIDDLEAALNSGLATQNGKIAAQNATIANVVANYNVEYGSTELWASTGETGALAAGTTVTLSEDVSHFDYIDIYSFCGNSNVLDTVPVDAKLQSSQGYALRWVNLSDPGSGSYKAYVRIIETRLHIIGTTLTIDHQVTYRNGEEVNISGAEITQSNRSTYMGELGIMKIVGRKITANTEIEDVRIGADGTEYASAGQAVRAQVEIVGDKLTNIKADLSEVTEATRNLNTSNMGRWGNAADGKIYSRNDTYYGMESFIPVTAGDEYIISYNNITSNDAIYISFMFVNDEGAVIDRTAYHAANPRVTIAPTGATKFNLSFYSSSEIFITDKTYVQIELGEIQTPHVPPVSAIDYVLRSDINEYPTYLFSSVIGGIIDNAEAYFEHAYNDENNLVYDSTHGLFSLQTTSDNEGEEGHPAIVCSQFVQAMTKYITWENSRYVKDINHVGQYCFTSDGNNQDTQDGEPYNYSYYQYENGVPYDANDIPSYDYMQSSEFYRYALNHSWAYEIKDRYPQLRPGDVIFSIDENSSFFKQITHCAFCVYTGFDNKYVILLESNHFSYKDKTNVGVGIRYAPLSSNKYGARFPLHELPHIAKVVEHGKPFATESTQQYNPTTLAYMKHESGFYTVVIRGTIPYANVPQIGVWYNGDTSRTYYRLMCNGNVHVCFFYAPTDFSSLTFAINTGSAVDIEKATLVKGYVPLT